MHDYVITDLNDDFSIVDTMIEKLQWNVNKFNTSYGNYRWYNPSIKPYYFCLQDMPRSSVLLSSPYCSADYSKVFD